MKALVSTEEKVYINNELVGNRIVQLSTQVFDVANTLLWVDCNDDVIADQYYYSTNNEVVKKPYPVK